MTKDEILSGLGTFSKQKLADLISVRSAALDGLRDSLRDRGYREVTTSSLVNIAGSCENPYASFRVGYYGREAHLSQSAQLQLEALVMRLQGPIGFFTVNSSFREESYEDPDASGRRLSEFTLVEAERQYFERQDEALAKLMEENEAVIKRAIHHSLSFGRVYEIANLGGDVEYLEKILRRSEPFPRLTYAEAIDLLGNSGSRYGEDLGIREQRAILKYSGNVPIFITYYPADLKFFNTKRADDGTTYSFDMLAPRLGEIAGGAIREQHGDKVKSQLFDSRAAEYLRERSLDPEKEFAEYLQLFGDEEPILRGGYGIGFERFVAFLLNSNDILETVAHKSLQP